MMIYFCADDYGLCEKSSERILRCARDGALNKISVFPNFGKAVPEIAEDSNLSLSLHLNLVEGKCIAQKVRGSVIADSDGNFRYTFGGLLRCSIFNKKLFDESVLEEVRAQLLLWKNRMPEGAKLRIDSHQHTHMIPGIFRAIMRVVREDGLELEYLRIPAEPLIPFIKEISLYHTYSPVNLIKQWLLRLLWAVNKRGAKSEKIPTAYFFGVLFSGCMDEKRVKKILPHYIKLAEKKKRDIEVLFHPGYLEKDEWDFGEEIAFKKFYLSEGRKTEFDTVMKMYRKEEI